MLMTGVKDDETGDINIVDAIPTALSYLFTILEEDDIMDLYKLVLETVYYGTEPVMNKFDTVFESDPFGVFDLVAEESFRQALYMAYDIYKSREWNKEISANPLKIEPRQERPERGPKIE
jgi:hypothetical protein